MSQADALAEARRLAESPHLAVPSEYLRALLVVGLAILDAREAPAVEPAHQPVAAPRRKAG